MNRKIILLLIIALISGSFTLIYYLSQDNITYYQGVNDILKNPNKFRYERVRVLGMVVPDSSSWDPQNLTLQFKITEDATSFLEVDFKGVKPDLFKEGQGVVAEGVMKNKFVADKLLVKHSPEYRVEHQDQKEQYQQYINTLNQVN